MAKHGQGSWRWIAGAAVILAVALAWYFLPLADWLQSLRRWIEDLGSYGPWIFALVYIVAEIASAPLTVVAGVAYGLWGIPLVIVTATTGAAAAFLIARYFLRTTVHRLIAGRPRLRAIDRAVGKDGWKVVAMLRLSPLFPFSLQNYFFGVTKISFVPFIGATLFGIMPGSALYVYLGMIGGAATGTESRSPLEWTFLGVGLLATIAVALFVAYKAKRTLRASGIGTKASKRD